MNLTRVTYDIKETNQILVKNALHMFERRGILSDYMQEYQNIESIIEPNKVIKIKTNDGSNALLYIVNDKVTSISQNSPIDEFLSSNTNLKKFVIINEPSKKSFKQILDYPNSEPFFQSEFMEDIPAKDIIPEHRLLKDEEKDELLQVLEIKNFKKIYTTDMMSRYFNAKPNDIFRINRKNVTSGNGIDYRVVIPGKLDLLFM